MSAAERPVPKDGVMDQDEQAALIRRTGDGVPVENEDDALREEWGEPDAQGTYGRNLEAEDVFGGDLA
ncbi:hypothetical protein SEA_INTOLERANT_33 [Streptomyces phage Intolerant]|nr:hypothetical protein SEA_INTOLERANT_33 [Streptomyces phage Intolerant]